MKVVDFTIASSETEYEALEQQVFRLERDSWDDFIVDPTVVPEKPIEWVPSPERHWLQFALLHETGHAVLASKRTFYGGGPAQEVSPPEDASYEIIVPVGTGVSESLLFESVSEGEVYYRMLPREQFPASTRLLVFDATDAQRIVFDSVPRIRWADGFRVLLTSFDEIRSQDREVHGHGDDARHFWPSFGHSYTDDDEPGNVEWTEEKNQRRCDLVDKEIDATLTADEAAELELLQKEMLAYRRQVAPLPIEDARKVHDELLRKAAEKKDQ